MQLYIRILSYGKSFMGQGLLALLMLLIFTVFSAISLMSVIPFLEILFQETAKATAAPEMAFSWLDPGSLKAWGYYKLEQVIIEVGDKQKVLIRFCGFLFVAILIKNLARYMSSFLFAPIEQGIIYKMRERLFDHLSRLGMPFYTRKKKGDILGLMVSDVQVIQESVIGTLQSVFRDPITMLTFLVAMLFISWKLTLFTLIVLPLTGVFINIIARTLRRRARKGQEALGALLSVMDEFISGIRVVKSYQKESHEAQKYKTQNTAYYNQQVAIKRRSDLASPLTEILSIIVVCIIILYGGSLILHQDGSLKASEFIGFIALFSQFLAPIKTFSTAISKIQKGIASYTRIEQLLDEQPEIDEHDSPIEVKSFNKVLQFDQVSFAYDQERVLNEISFSLAKGETLALVGPSGGGKSTIADLLMRFYDPIEGAILLDGHDYRSMSLKDLRGLYGYVSQEGILFHDSVHHNIAYGLEVSRDEVKAAARIANADEFISQLSEGYDTLIGERGTKLSGGQRQRISIARAILRDPEILILDEATSNLDTESERLVQEAIDKLTVNRTSVVIAHRLSTILQADKILVIDRGRLVEQGSHADLLAEGGLYKKLYQHQFAIEAE